jgi:hypothetical protein
MKLFQHKSAFLFFSVSIIFLSAAALPVKAGVLVIAYMDESKVVLVDGKTYKTVATLDSGKNPHEVRVSHDKRRAYVAAGKTITVVDLKNRKIKANFDLGEVFGARHPRQPGQSPIWLACAGKEAIWNSMRRREKFLIYTIQNKRARGSSKSRPMSENSTHRISKEKASA